MTLVWHTENRKLVDLKPYDKNPRTLDQDMLEKLILSIKQGGYVAPIIIDLDNTIVGGHARQQAMLALGFEEVEVRVPHRKLTEQEFDAINIRDNVSFGRWDIELLSERFEVEYLTELGLDIELPDPDPVSANAEEDEAPEPPDAPISQSGDLWQIGPHSLLVGDSTSLESFSKLLGTHKADMIFTDPPYNVAYTGKTKDAMTIQNDKMGREDFLTFLKQVFAGMAESIQQGGAIYVAHADTEGESFRYAFRHAGFKLSSCISWVKQSMVMGRSDYHWRHEPILYGWKEGASHHWYGDRTQTTVWEVDRPSRNAEHPTMKPVGLIEIALKNSSEVGNIVLDPFLGSGSTMVACHKNNRICYGLEIDPKYADVIVRRMLTLYPDLKLLRNGEPYTWTA